MREKERKKCVAELPRGQSPLDGRIRYVPPRIEVFPAGSCQLLVSSPLNGRHIRGDVDSGSDGFATHMRGAADTGGTSGGNNHEDGFAVHIRGNADYWD